MSTYHVLNAVWIGVFPMLAMAVLIAALCYLLCCLNQIKVKFQHYRKKKQLKKARKKLLKQQQQQQQQRIHFQHRESLEVDTNRTEFNFSKSMSSPPYAFSYSEDVDTDTNSYFHNETTKSPPPSLFMHRYDSQKEKTRFPPPFNLTRSSLRLDLSNQFKPIRNGSNSSPEKTATTTTITKTNTTQQDTSVEQLIVEDLKESPTSAYTRLNSLARLAYAQKITTENILTESSPTQPINVPSPPPSELIVPPLSPSNPANCDKILKDKAVTSCASSISDLECEKNHNSNYNSTATNTTHEYDDDDNEEKTSLSHKSSKKIYSLHTRGSNLNLKMTSSLSRVSSPANIKKSNSLKRKAKLLSISKRSHNSISDIEKEDDLVFNVDDDNDSLSSTIELSQHTLVSATNNTNHQISIVESKEAIEHAKNETSPARFTPKRTEAKISSSMSDIDPDEDILKNLLKKN